MLSRVDVPALQSSLILSNEHKEQAGMSALFSPRWQPGLFRQTSSAISPDIQYALNIKIHQSLMFCRVLMLSLSIRRLLERSTIGPTAIVIPWLLVCSVSIQVAVLLYWQYQKCVLTAAWIPFQ